MEPNIDENLKLFDLGAYKTAGAMAQIGQSRKARRRPAGAGMVLAAREPEPFGAPRLPPPD
jgi:hypothetical protein